MSKGFKFKLDKKGVRELLKDSETAAVCTQYGSQVLSRAGDGYMMESRNYPERTGVAIFPDTYKAKKDNLEHNTLLKALGGGR